MLDRSPAGTVLRVSVAGSRGIPGEVKAASVNLVALDSHVTGWLRAVPCGTPSDVSNLNYLDAAPVANGANVKLSGDGAICVTSSETVARHRRRERRVGLTFARTRRARQRWVDGSVTVATYRTVWTLSPERIAPRPSKRPACQLARPSSGRSSAY